MCDNATVYVDISVCPSPFNENVIAGQVFMDSNKDGLNNDGGVGVAGAKVYLYADGNCNGAVNANELKDSITVDASGTYQFITYPEKNVADDFDGAGGARTCANGSDGNTTWLSDWVDAGDQSIGFCNTTNTAANTDADIFKDGAFTNALRLKDKSVSATRTVNLSGASYAFLSFSYRRKSATLTAGHDVIVQASSNGSTFGTIFTIAGDGTTDAAYVNIYNQDITSYAAATTYIRFLTNANMLDADTVYIDNVKVQFLRYPQCYITRIDSTTIPINYNMTTTVARTLTASSSATCFAPYDFGISTTLTTLPIVSIPLSGLSKQNDNWLNWSTESEKNSNYFEVENSINGSAFTSIGKVIAKGNSNIKSSYNFIHYNPSKVTNYYRIKLLDKGGNVNYSNIISIKPSSNQSKLTVMPNPFNSNILISVTFGVQGKALISIIDMYGKTVKTLNYNVNQGINFIPVTDLESLPAGTYIVQIKNQAEVVFSKIIKL